MKTSLLTLGAVSLLGAGVVIHHSGHCPLMDAHRALTHHATPASTTPAIQAASAVKANAVVLTSTPEEAR